MNKMTRATVLLSLALFLVSFFVTAVKIDVDSLLGWRVSVHGSISGWQAAWGALANVRDAIVDPGSILGALHAVTNLVVVFSMVLLLGPYGVRWQWPGHVSLVATLFNASLLFTLQGAAALGYYLWLASFAGVTVSLYARTRGSGGHLTMSANHPLQPPAGGRCGVDSPGTCARRG
jgi:hypothetical protein